MTIHPNINRIILEDLKDAERLKELYCQAVQRKYWPNNTKALLDFFALAEKAKDDDKQKSPEKLFAWQLKNKHVGTITDTQEIRAEQKLLQLQKQLNLNKHEIVDQAAKQVKKKSGWHIQGDIGEAREILADSNEIAFVPAVMTQVFFPQNRVPLKQELYESYHGNACVYVRRGYLLHPDWPRVKKHERCEMPYGNKARIILPYIVTESIRTKNREIDMGHSLRKFMKSVGMPITGRNAREITQQVKNIAAASIIFGYWTEERVTQRNEFIVSSIDFWIEKDERQATIWNPTLELSKNFYDLIQKTNIPFRMDHLARLKTPRQKDLYLWLCYRTPQIPKGKPVAIRLDTLHRIFAPQINELRNFKIALKRNLQVIWQEFKHFRLEIKGDILLVHHSPPLVEPTTYTLSVQGYLPRLK